MIKYLQVFTLLSLSTIFVLSGTIAHSHNLPDTLVRKMQFIYLDSAMPSKDFRVLRLRAKVFALFLEYLDRQIISVDSKSIRETVIGTLVDLEPAPFLPRMVQGGYLPETKTILYSPSIQGTVVSLITILHESDHLILDLTQISNSHPVARAIEFFDPRSLTDRLERRAFDLEHDFVTELWALEEDGLTLSDLVLEDFGVPTPHKPVFELLFQDMRIKNGRLYRDEGLWTALRNNPDRIYELTQGIAHHQLDLGLQKIYPIRNSTQTEYTCGKLLAPLYDRNSC